MSATTTTTSRAEARAAQYRALSSSPELRVRPDNGHLGVMHGHAAPFNKWTEINSVFEGRFLERFVPGAFARTIEEDRDRIRVLLDHGFDPFVGDKPLGPITELREDEEGLYFAVSLIPTSYNQDLVAALESPGDLYGMSVRMKVLDDTWEDNPRKSKENPSGLPQRTIKRAKLIEVSATVFPAYHATSASLRTNYLMKKVRSGKPWTAARRRTLIRQLGGKPTTMTADHRKAELAAMGLRTEPMSAAERKAQLAAMGLRTEPMSAQERKANLEAMGLTTPKRRGRLRLVS